MMALYYALIVLSYICKGLAFICFKADIACNYLVNEFYGFNAVAKVVYPIVKDYAIKAKEFRAEICAECRGEEVIWA